MRAYLLVAAGGALGATARWGTGELVAKSASGFPWPTLIVNLIGSALIGLAARQLIRGSYRWLGAVTGFLGGLTTFSTFSVETRGLIDGGHSGLAITYVAATVVGGLIATEIARSGRAAS